MNELARDRLTVVGLESENDKSQNQLKLRWEEAAGRLSLKKNDEWLVVQVKACFPWGKDMGNYSLRDGDANEVGFVETLENLEIESRQALLKSLRESSFHFEVTEILEMNEEFELRTWLVETRQGPRKFQTRLTDWPRHIGEGCYIIRDVQKDLFVIEDIKSLNATSKKLFWPFSDIL